MNNELIENAKLEAERIIKEAEIKAEEMLSESALLKAVQKKAEEIQKEVKQNCEKIKAETKSSNNTWYAKYKETKNLAKDRWKITEFETSKKALFTDYGEQLTDFIYSEIYNASTKDDNYYLISISKNGRNKYGLMDKFGCQIIPPISEDWNGGFFDGLALLRVDGKYGYVNSANENVIPFQYDKAKNFSLGKAQVELNGRTFFIDKKGNEITG